MMGRKKPSSALKEVVPSMEEVFKAHGISSLEVQSVSKESSAPSQGLIEGHVSVQDLKEKGVLTVKSVAGLDKEGKAAESDPSKVHSPARSQGSVCREETGSPSVSQTLGSRDTDQRSQVDPAADARPQVKQAVNKPASWVGLFKDNRKLEQGHTLKKYVIEQDEVVLVPGEVYSMPEALGSCLVGYFAGKFPGKLALIKLCESWKVRYQYYVHPNGWLIFKFADAVSRDQVLKGGPYFVFGRPLMLKVMPPFFEFDANSFSSVPVWINYPGLPMDFWHPEALSKITSKVGTPIATDKLTASLQRFSYARVLVEVDASKELVRSVRFRMASGKAREQRVVYEFEPKFCSDCKTLGHSKGGCKAKQQVAEKSAVRVSKVGEDESIKEPAQDKLNPDKSAQEQASPVEAGQEQVTPEDLAQDEVNLQAAGPSNPLVMDDEVNAKVDQRKLKKKALKKKGDPVEVGPHVLIEADGEALVAEAQLPIDDDKLKKRASKKMRDPAVKGPRDPPSGKSEARDEAQTISKLPGPHKEKGQSLLVAVNLKDKPTKGEGIPNPKELSVGPSGQCRNDPLGLGKNGPVVDSSAVAGKAKSGRFQPKSPQATKKIGKKGQALRSSSP